MRHVVTIVNLNGALDSLISQLILALSEEVTVPSTHIVPHLAHAPVVYVCCGVTFDTAMTVKVSISGLRAVLGVLVAAAGAEPVHASGGSQLFHYVPHSFLLLPYFLLSLLIDHC